MISFHSWRNLDMYGVAFWPSPLESSSNSNHCENYSVLLCTGKELPFRIPNQNCMVLSSHIKLTAIYIHTSVVLDQSWMRKNPMFIQDSNRQQSPVLIYASTSQTVCSCYGWSVKQLRKPSARERSGCYNAFRYIGLVSMIYLLSSTRLNIYSLING